MIGKITAQLQRQLILRKLKLLTPQLSRVNLATDRATTYYDRAEALASGIKLFPDIERLLTSFKTYVEKNPTEMCTHLLAELDRRLELLFGNLSIFAKEYTRLNNLNEPCAFFNRQTLQEHEQTFDSCIQRIEGAIRHLLTRYTK
jgi:hypothetical protein